MENDFDVLAMGLCGKCGCYGRLALVLDADEEGTLGLCDGCFDLIKGGARPNEDSP